MANRFMDSFGTSNMQNQNIFAQIASMRQNPNQFLANQINALANQGINVPAQYQNNPEMTAKYLLQNTPAAKQNQILQAVNSLRSMFGI